MLKLCLALPIFYPTFGGGPLRILRSQAGLRKRDVHARVLTGTPRSKDDFHSLPGDEPRAAEGPIGSMLPIDSVDGIPVHRVQLPSDTGVHRTSTYFRALLALCEDPATRPDVVQLHSFERVESLYWLWRLRRLRIPIVHAIQIARPVRRSSSAGRFAERRFRRAYYDGFDAVLTNSEAIRSTLRDWAVRSPIEVVPNGVDFARYRSFEDEGVRSKARKHLGIRGSGPVVLGVGAICPRKGSDLLVEAWKQLLDQHPETELLLVGPRHDQNNPNLEAFGQRLRDAIANSPRPDRVHLAGVRDDMNEVYAAADIVVLASAREGMPNSVIEAMACRRPVLLTPFLGQSTHLGRPGIEYLQSDRSATALAGHLAALLEKPALREELVLNGRQWVERHLDLESNLDHLAEFYRWAANRRAMPSRVHALPVPRPASDSKRPGGEV